jgi:diguanylate cyclase (GGDEF)-like protein/PAS domain S-box-containing protein
MNDRTDTADLRSGEPAFEGELRVLLVEDAPADAELCRRELTRAAIRHTARCVDRRGAFERALEEFRPHLVLSDFSMPTDFDGLAALEITRAWSPEVPFIFVSGTIGEDRAVEAMRRGATDYVLKDRLNRLVPVIERALKEARASAERRRAQDALGESEARFRSFMQHLPGRAAIRDLEGRYTYVNGAWERGLDRPAAEVIGRRPEDLLTPEHAAELRAAHAEVAASREPARRVFQSGTGSAAAWWLSHHFPIPDAAGRVAFVGEVALDITEQKLQEERIAYLAYYDELTGLPNRTLFNVWLENRASAVRGGPDTLSVIMLDVEHFQRVNDTLGRPAGDELLRQVARRLKESLLETDILARLGGDYFAIATRGFDEAGDFAHILEQILSDVGAQPFAAGGGELRIAARAGVAVFPADGADADGLLKNAEAALKDAKQRGHRYQFYAPQMNARVAEQLKLESDLRRAVAEEQFVLHYQPRMELAGGRIIGLEALVRWAHPERGLIAPGEFISTLETTGLVLDVGRWALKRAAQDHAGWCARGLAPPRIAVNVSAIQLRRRDFVEQVTAALAGAGDSGRFIDIEITESMLMEDIEGNIAKLQAVKAMGMHVAMDDFGTGYSSLSYLALLPINSLKIDRSFIVQMAQGPERMAIVSTIISLARAFGLRVVAEGVETEEQSRLLRLLHCDEGQGYLYSQALSASGLEVLLRRA